MRKLIFNVFLLLAVSSYAQEFTLQGNATVINNNTYQLTPNSTQKAGLITSLYPLNLTTNFELNFELYLGANNGNGADGIGFMISKSCNPTLQAGQGMGVSGTPNSLIAEFDTYFNGAYSFENSYEPHYYF